MTITAGILTWGFGSSAGGTVPCPDPIVPTSNYRPKVSILAQIPSIQANTMAPVTQSTGEPQVHVYSEGEDRASVLTDDLRPRIIEIKEDD